MSDGFRTTTLPEAEGDLIELIGNAQVQGFGPLATRRMTADKFLAQLMGSTSALGMKFAALDTTDNALKAADQAFAAQIASLQAGQSSGQIIASTWAELTGRTAAAGTPAEIPDTDAGTHTDPITGAAATPNSGRFKYVTGTPAGWTRVSDSNAKMAAAALLANSVLKTTIGDAEYILIPGADRKTTSLITFADFASALEAKIVEKRFVFELEGTASPTSKLWWAADPARNGGQIRHNGSSGLLMIGYGKAPVPYSAWTSVLNPGDWEDLNHGSQRAIYLATDGVTIPVYSYFTNTSNVNPLASYLGDALLARLSGGQSTTEKAAIKALVKDFVDPGIYFKFKMAQLLAASDTTSARVDMVRDGSDGGPSTLTLFNDPVFTKNIGFKGDGTAAYFNTNYVPSTDTRIGVNNHSAGVYVNNPADVTGAFAMGSVNLSIGVNRAGNAATARSASTSTDVVSVAGRGGLFALSRKAADKYRFIYKQTAQDVTRASSSLGANAYPMLGLCNNGGGGPTAFTQTTPHFMFVAEYLTDAELFAIDTAVAKYLTAIGT